MTKKILIGIFIFFLLLQLFQPSKNLGDPKKDNPIHLAVDVPDDVHRLLKAACYDCHSNQTNYPWYANISPVSIWLNDHVVSGKRAVNYSEFASYPRDFQQHKLKETAEYVAKKYMPLPSYMSMHAGARLSPQQRERIIQWASSAAQSLGSLNQ